MKAVKVKKRLDYPTYTLKKGTILIKENKKWYRIYQDDNHFHPSILINAHTVVENKLHGDHFGGFFEVESELCVDCPLKKVKP